MPRAPRFPALLLLAVAAAACAPRGGSAPAALGSFSAVAADTAAFPEGWAFPAGSLPTVRARGGMVVTTDRVASEVGGEILRRGGNAVDAAVAVHLALAVVNPEAGNIGGGGFLVARMVDGTMASLDFRETAPLRATRDMFLDSAGRPTDRSTEGHLASGVPGSVAGMWEAHRRFGSLRWADLVEPAIALAEGIVVHERLAASLRNNERYIRRNPSLAELFVGPAGVLRVGDRLAQPELAATLRRVRDGGADGFYRGRTAELLEAEMRSGGGLITREDLARYKAVWRDPVRFTYRGHTVVSMPPPSSGGVTMAAILKTLEGYDLRAAGFLSPRHVHLFAEASRRAYADRNAYLADPDFVPQPTARMTSDAYAAERRATIRPDRATPSVSIRPGLGPVPGEGTHTTHYSIVDGRGNAVAVTTTINSLYGSGVRVRGAGFILNNEMDDFTARPGVPNQFGLVQGAANAVQPGKRMLSAMSPTVVLDPSGRVVLVTGTPGGATIITSVASVVSNVIDFGMDEAASNAAPRLHHQHLPDTLRYERGGLSPATVASLRAMGHAVVEREGYQGDVQSIMVMRDGTLAGVADPRRGGAAVGVAVARAVVQ